LGEGRRSEQSIAGQQPAAEKRDELAASHVGHGGLLPSQTLRMTVAAFLERWIEHMQGQVSPRSHERYAEIARKNIAPLLGGIALTKLAYAKALASGRRDGSGGLSARTVQHMHRVLSEALQQAVGWQMLARNPADAVKPPKVERKQMSVLDTDATIELIEAARPYRIFVPIL
jgi:site-specific recombinase XerC